MTEVHLMAKGYFGQNKIVTQLKSLGPLKAMEYAWIEMERMVLINGELHTKGKDSRHAADTLGRMWLEDHGIDPANWMIFHLDTGPPEDGECLVCTITVDEEEYR